RCAFRTLGALRTLGTFRALAALGTFGARRGLGLRLDGLFARLTRFTRLARRARWTRRLGVKRLDRLAGLVQRRGLHGRFAVLALAALGGAVAATGAAIARATAAAFAALG